MVHITTHHALLGSVYSEMNHGVFALKGSFLMREAKPRWLVDVLDEGHAERTHESLPDAHSFSHTGLQKQVGPRTLMAK